MIRREWIGVAVMVCALATWASRCDAWNSTGHEAVAQVAWDQLSPADRAVIVGILRNHPRVNEDLLHDEVRAKDDNLAIFLRAATWPDMIRYPAHPMTHTEHHPRWHYVDFPFEQDGVKGPQPDLHWDGHSDPANLVEALQKALTELKNPATHKDRKAIDVCWVEHLVGDIHQPLHATSWYTHEYPNGDQGANLVLIKLDNGEVINLHSYWDSIEGMSLDPNDIRKIADRVESEHPLASLKDRAADLSVVDWARESYDLARSVVYQDGTLPHAVRHPGPMTPGTTMPSAPPLPAGYAEKGLAVADERIALGGYRLAEELREIVKENQ